MNNYHDIGPCNTKLLRQIIYDGMIQLFLCLIASTREGRNLNQKIILGSVLGKLKVLPVNFNNSLVPVIIRDFKGIYQSLMNNI
jgi:hypothetical protein